MDDLARAPRFVSIVTPTRNQAAFIEATVDSIRAQTYTNFEHIVVDGASTDTTVDILRRLEGTYPMRWMSEPDKGMYDAVNKGLALATGDILCYLNSDDLYFPWTLETVVRYFKRHPEVDFVYGDALSVEDETDAVEAYWTPPFNLAFLRAIGFLAQPTVFWRRSVYEREGGFDTSLRYVADCDYWMRCGATSRFAKVDEFLAAERDHPGTLRLATGGAVWTELDAVRARYPGASPVLPHRYRRAIWARLYPLLLMTAAAIPGRRRGAWSRMLATGTLRFSRTRLLVRLVPRIGFRLAGPAYRPNGWWLRREPAKPIGSPSGAAPADPVVSIVIASRNAADSIERAIQSIVGQSSAAWELVVMDGASTDGTAEIIARHEAHIAYCESEPDRGISHAWNKALRACQGDWVLFLGADDQLAGPDVLRDVVARLPEDGTATPVAYGMVRVVDAAGATRAVLGQPWEAARAVQTHRNVLPHQGILHHRSMFERAGPFDETLTICADYERLLRELRRSQPQFLGELVITEMGDGGISRRPDGQLTATIEQHRARYLNGYARVPAWCSPRILRARAYALVQRRLGEQVARRVADALAPLWAGGPRSGS